MATDPSSDLSASPAQPSARAYAPEFHLDDRPARNQRDERQLRIVNGSGEIVAVIPRGTRSAAEQDRDTRMMAFSGKLHRALGNVVSNVSLAAAAIEEIGKTALSPEEKNVRLMQAAGQLREAVAVERKAYDGALLSGDEAVAFDEEWRQDGVPSDQDLLDAGKVDEYRARHPYVSAADLAMLMQERGYLSGTGKLIATGKMEQRARDAQFAQPAIPESVVDEEVVRPRPPLPTPMGQTLDLGMPLG
jgi:hypothetical protein